MFFVISLLVSVCLLGLGGMFLFAGLTVLAWTSYHNDHDWSWFLPSAFGAFLLYMACLAAPFTIAVERAA